MASNLYHILFEKPCFHDYDTSKQIDLLATAIVESGRLRIDAGDKVNFTRFWCSSHHSTYVFSYRELYDHKILKNTIKLLKNIYSYKASNNRQLNGIVNNQINKLRNNLRKYNSVSQELEMQIARVFVQSAHPAVIMMLILESVEIFITYGFVIGDVMDIPNWKTHGNNSGMQSTNSREVAIFVSCGGDPFDFTEDKNSKKERTYGDGFPALARFMVIAAQEIGHYSDIMRNIHGQQISRYSANFAGTKAKEHVKLGRKKDMRNLPLLAKKLTILGLDDLIRVEKSLQFYQSLEKFWFKRCYLIIKIWMMQKIFIRKCKKSKLNFVASLDNIHQKMLGININMMIEDMKFNLAPIADVYQDPDKEVEEAIACVEAVARVPQQVVKWGHLAAKTFMSKLYKIYYGEIIQGSIVAYEAISHKKYNFKITKRKMIWLRKLKTYFLGK
jgi:hypothetical protein